MSFVLPELPYPKDAFGKILSSQTFDYHHGKHHQAYVNNLNANIKGTQWENRSLIDIVLLCKEPKIFNNAAQHLNHSFYWTCITPNSSQPIGNSKDAIIKKWGSVSKFLDEFTAQAAANFGSGWTWLSLKPNVGLVIENTSNATNAMNLDNGSKPLLTVDIWQHAYYIDYRNVRAQYLANYATIIDWKFVENNYNQKNPQIHL